MLKILYFNDELYSSAISYFSNEYITSLQNKPNPKVSLVCRYVISQIVKDEYGINNYYPKSKPDGVPIFDNIFRSISHKDNNILIGVDKEPLGVDLEIYKERSIELMQTFSIEEWNLIGEKNFWNFYYLWTIKESFIKYKLLGLNDLNKINIINIENINHTISNLYFNKLFMIKHNGENYYSYGGSEGNFIYALTKTNLIN